MEYIPTGKKPEFKYSIGDFVCYRDGDTEYYGQIKLHFYENGKPIYGIINMRPVVKGGEILWFEIDQFATAVYEEDIF